MIHRTLLDAAGNPLLYAWRMEADSALWVREEGLPELLPGGEIVDVSGTGARLYTGGDHLRAGSYRLSLGTHGAGPDDLFALQRRVVAAATRARAVTRGNETLLLARFERIRRIVTGGAQLHGAVELEFAPAWPYWLGAPRTQALSTSDFPNQVEVGGDGPAHPVLTITAGNIPAPVRVTTEAGTLSLLGTLPENSTLVIDTAPGRWAATIGGVDVSHRLVGPQPRLRPGLQTVRVSAGGSVVRMSWQEAYL